MCFTGHKDIRAFSLADSFYIDYIKMGTCCSSDHLSLEKEQEQELSNENISPLSTTVSMAETTPKKVEEFKLKAVITP